MKLSVVIPVHNQIELAKACYREIIGNTDSGTVEFIIIDNGSDEPILWNDFPQAVIHRTNNIGVYPTFELGMDISKGDIVAFLHSDVVIWEKEWDVKVIEAFEKNRYMGLAGFVGSDEIDSNGGRGGGTASNFQGREITNGLKSWKGSSWDKHGKHLTGVMNAAVVDGCVMILQRNFWYQINTRIDFPPHHFYDRLISTQMLEKGFKVGVIGVEFDHISGQTVNQEKGYQRMAHAWLKNNPNISIRMSVGDFKDDHNYDSDIYKLAEIYWLKEYRDTKHIIPIKV